MLWPFILSECQYKTPPSPVNRTMAQRDVNNNNRLNRRNARNALLSEIESLRDDRYEILSRFLEGAREIQGGQLSAAERNVRYSVMLNLSNQFLDVQRRFRELSAQLEPREE
jgi:hypothetical protein